MKKINILGLILAFAFITLLFYLLYKTWIVFGFWTLAWTSLVTTLSELIIANLVGSRKETNGVIIFNPKEWPKFIHIFICLIVGYYLYTIISRPTTSSSDYSFGISYLILLTVVPIIYSLYKLIRDRNDFVKIDGYLLSYRDNSEIGQIDLNNVKKVSGQRDIDFELLDESKQKIKLSQMNFNKIDRDSLLKEIQLKTPQNNETPKDNI